MSAHIAFVGPQGSGKSTLAEMLEQRRKSRYIVLPIAQTIREVASLAYGVDFDKGKHYEQRRLGSVSYTHLTLPTKRIV